MNPQDSGHKGGVKTKENHYTLCPLCGSLIKSRFYSETGEKGGQATLQRYGREHYVRAGRRGGRGNKKNGIVPFGNMKTKNLKGKEDKECIDV